jgi:hypothetical protein
VLDKLTVDGIIDPTGMVFDEQADHPTAPAPAKGILWVKNAAPNELWFTDDAGTDFQISGDLYAKNDGDNTRTLIVDKNTSGVGAENTKALYVDFDRTVAGSGTAAHNDIGIDLDVNSASLGTSSVKGIDIDVVGATSGTHTATGLDVAVSGADTNYAIITSGGNVGIGISAPVRTLHVKDTNTGSNGFPVRFQGNEGNVLMNQYGHLHLVNDNTSPPSADAIDSPRWGIGERDSQNFDLHHGNVVSSQSYISGDDAIQSWTTGGDSTLAGSLTESSDERLKENIVDYEAGLNEILNLSPKQFDWKSDGRSSIGLIAQDVEKVLPEIVKESNEGMLSIAYNRIIPALINAIKTLEERIKSLED